MDRNSSKNKYELPRVHRARASSRSPTRTMDAIREKQLSKSVSGTSSTCHNITKHELEKQQTTFSATGVTFPERNQTDDITGKDNTKGNAIKIVVKNFDSTFSLERSCTVQEYMKWKYILSSPKHLNQFNLDVKEKLVIPLVITSDSVLHVCTQDKIDDQSVIQKMSDIIVTFAVDQLGKGLCVYETDIESEHIKQYFKKLEESKLDIYAEVLRGHLYFVFMNRNKKPVTEYLEGIICEADKQKYTSRIVRAQLIWQKLAKMIKLDDILKSTELEIKLSVASENFIITFEGPKTAVDLAEQEFESLDKHILREKCNLQVTSKFALTELQVDTFLDDQLAKHGVRCVTCQKNKAIYVYGFKEECLRHAKKEIEETIIEKPYFIKGQLKARKETLVSYLSGRWPGKVVIHIEDSGSMHIVGLKQCVEDTYQTVSDLNEGKLKSEDLSIVLATKVEEIAKVETAAEEQTYGNRILDRREAMEDTKRRIAFVKEERSDSQGKVRTDIDLNNTRNSHDMMKKEDRPGELRMDEGLKQKQIPNDNTDTHRHELTERRIVEGHVTTKEGRSVKYKVKNKGTKEEVEDACTIQRTELQGAEMEEQRNISRTVEYANGVALKYIDENTDTKCEVDTTCRREQKEVTQPRLEDHKAISKPPRESEMISECFDYSDKKIFDFTMKPDSRTFLIECANENSVAIQECINRGICTDDVEVTEDVLIAPNKDIERTVTWKTAGNKQMVLTMKRRMEDMVDPGSRFILVKFKDNSPSKGSISVQRKLENGVNVVVHMPRWNDKQNDGPEQLTELLAQLFSDAEDSKIDHVILRIEDAQSWPTSAFIVCVISKTVESTLLNSKIKRPHIVTLFLSDVDKFDKVLKYTDQYIRKCSEAVKAKQNQLQVSVIHGELDKAKADVIVNTTSKDLELSNGKVSATLLKAAGSGIQAECRTKYPKGIKKHEIAVTGGHRLGSENVFHIALDRYIAQQEMHSIESIRSLMLECLQTASRMNKKTIAFPAIGTGVLKYPVDLVAAAMFESVERFKSEFTDTSLTTVFFVIYPSDLKVMQVFKTNEETLCKPPDDGRRMKQDTKIQVKLYGQRENVARTRLRVVDRFDDELHDPREIQEQRFTGITYQVYLALLQVYEESLTSLRKDGIEIKHQDDVLFLSGKHKKLKHAAKRMNDFIKQVLKYNYVSMSVVGCDPRAVKDNVQLANREKDIVCIFDEFRYIVHIYAHSSGRVSRVSKLFCSKVGLETCKTLVCNEKTPAHHHTRNDITVSSLDVHTEQQFSKQEHRLYESENSKRKENLNKHNKSHIDVYTPEHRSERQFSWTQHFKNHKLYQANTIMVHVYEADILGVPVDCIVNPVNKHLDHHGGLAYSIAKCAGDSLEKESADIVKLRGGSLPVTSVVRTTAGRLKYTCILHAVGPCWNDYTPTNEKSITECLNDLRLTVKNCFLQAEQSNIETIALPTVSSGLFGVPKQLCAIQYASAIQEFCGNNDKLKAIHIVDISHDMVDILHEVFQTMLGQQKTIAVDLRDYIQVTCSQNTEKIAGQTHLKNTVRDKPKIVDAYKNVRDVVKTADNEVTNVNNDDKLSFTFPPNHVVHIYESDILKLEGIQTLVCSDNRKGEGKGEVSRQLLEAYGDKHKSEHFEKKRDIGDVITISGEKSNFKYIMYAITPKKDLKALHMMYINVFEEVIKNEIRSIALHLLGTGSGRFEPTESTEALLEEWITFSAQQKQYPLTIHIVLYERTTSDLVKEIFRKRFDAIGFNASPTQCQGWGHKSIPDNADNSIDSKDTEEDCVICMDKVNVPKKLKCGHQFCTECIEGYFRVKEVCPTCGQVCGVITGDQPDGQVDVRKINLSCAGYEGHKSIAVTYHFPFGTQGETHPRPGSFYTSISRTGYLPDTKEGREVCAMLKVAFERRLVFTIGTSRTTGQEGVITWNDVHHKTDMRPNTQFGYPDKTYLLRVREELAVKGVTEEDIDEDLIKDLESVNYRRSFTTDTSL